VAPRSIREFSRQRTENGSEVAQKALLFGDDIPAIATIGFGEFERRPEMGLDVAVAELGTPAPQPPYVVKAAAQKSKSMPRDSA
jgi:hypothetical protein